MTVADMEPLKESSSDEYEYEARSSLVSDSKTHSLSRTESKVSVLPCPTSEDTPSADDKPVNLRLLLWQFFRVSAAFFLGDAKWKARVLMGFVIVMAVSATGVNVLVSYNQRDVTTALTEKRGPEFYAAVWKFTAICAAAAPFFALFDYLKQLMALEWRLWLTDLLLSKYFSKRAFFDLKMEGVLDNPDQRIAEDTRNFVAKSVDLIVLLVEKVLSILAFSAVLWSISPTILLFLLGYAVLGTVVSMFIFGRKLMWIQFHLLQSEADMRYSLVRVRDNVESIAFYRGEHREAANVHNFLGQVVRIVRRYLLWTAGLNTFTSAYKYATYMMPVVGLAPAYFEGSIEYGQIVQTAMAFDEIFAAVTIIVMNFQQWTGLAAETERLESLLAALKVYSGDTSLSISETLHSTKSEKNVGTQPKQQSDEKLQEGFQLVDLNSIGEGPTETPLSPCLSQSPMISRSIGSSLAVDDLQIILPRTGEILFQQGLSFKLEEGQSLLIMGPSGCGKSSLLRVISGLWNSGRGRIECPAERNLFFLPQKPYMTFGSLREQLLFPLPASTQGEALDQQLSEVLNQVNLQSVLKRFPRGLDEDCDWSDSLSVGEQQRIAFARLLICKPRMAFLDEATSALDGRNEKHLYSLLKEHVPSFVSVGHRPTLIPFHTHVLWFDEERGVWSIMPSPTFQQQHGVLPMIVN